MEYSPGKGICRLLRALPGLLHSKYRPYRPKALVHSSRRRAHCPILNIDRAGQAHQRPSPPVGQRRDGLRHVRFSAGQSLEAHRRRQRVGARAGLSGPARGGGDLGRGRWGRPLKLRSEPWPAQARAGGRAVLVPGGSVHAGRGARGKSVGFGDAA